MEGATLSGRQASAYVCGAGEELVALRKTLAAVESQDGTKSQNLIDELSPVWSHHTSHIKALCVWSQMAVINRFKFMIYVILNAAYVNISFNYEAI